MMIKKKAFITGINGQDGSYMADFLLDKGYKVFGMERRSSSLNRDNTGHLEDNENFQFITGDFLFYFFSRDVLFDVIATNYFFGIIKIISGTVTCQNPKDNRNSKDNLPGTKYKRFCFFNHVNSNVFKQWNFIVGHFNHKIAFALNL